MENIMAYDSNSGQEYDDEDREVGCSNDEHKADCEIIAVCGDKSQQTLNVEMKSSSFAIKEESAGFNFFGIDTGDRKIRQYQSLDSIPIPSSQKNRKVETDYGEVEIPSGDFWKEFTADDITDITQTQTSHAEYFRRPTCESSSAGTIAVQYNSAKVEVSETSQKHHSLKRQICDSHTTDCVPFVHKRKQVRHNSNSHAFTDPAYADYQIPDSYDNNQEIFHQFPQQSSSSIAPRKHETSVEGKRKLYCIHSKVAPFLNSRPSNRCSSKHQTSWAAHVGVVNRLGWNVPNYSHLVLSAGMDAAVKVWNVWSSLDQCVATFYNHKKAVKHAEWCQDGRKIVSCSFDRTAHITDVETAKVLGVCEHTDFVTAGCTHATNPNLFATGGENVILMWDLRMPQAPVKHFSYKDKFGQVQDLLFIKDGQELISCSDMVSRDSADRGIMAWDLRSGVVLSNQIFQERYTCTRLKLHPNMSHFMAQTQGGYIAIFSTPSPYKIDKSKRCEGHKMQGYGIGFDLSPDGSLVYSGSAEAGIHCYDYRSGRQIRKLPRGRDVIIDVACHPVLPSIIVSCTWGGSINLWQ